MSPEAKHILDWFPLSMKLTVLDQYAKGLVPCDQTLGEEIRDKIECLKWSLWYGNLYKAFYKIEDIESLIYTSSPYTFFLLNSDMELYRNSHLFV